MLTSLSLWGIYFASYLVDYVLILVILIVKHMTQENGSDFLKGAGLLIYGILMVFIVVSIVIITLIQNMEPNTRITIIPDKDITFEMTGYLFAQVVTVATTILTDWWVIINVALFIIVGVFFVKSKAVYTSPLFVVPLGNSIYKTGNNIIVTNYSIQEMRMAQEDCLDGLEARELTDKVFYIRK